MGLSTEIHAPIVEFVQRKQVQAELIVVRNRIELLINLVMRQLLFRDWHIAQWRECIALCRHRAQVEFRPLLEEGALIFGQRV